MRQRHKTRTVTRSTKLWGVRYSPELTLRSTEFCAPENLNFPALYQKAKNKAFSSICSEEIVNFKILQSNWLRVFWPIYPEQDLWCIGYIPI